MRHARVRAAHAADAVEITGHARGWWLGDRAQPAAAFDWAPVATGQVYGVALNHRAELAARAPSFAEPPYLAPPRAAVLYVKPVNTHAAHGANVTLPAGALEVEIGGTLGVVMGATANRLSADAALAAVRGYTIAADLMLAGAGLHRPPIRETCFDGACPIGPWWVDAAELGDPARLEVRVSVNGESRQHWYTKDLLRSVPALLAHVTAFMTLDPGDVVLAGLGPERARARAGDAVSVTIERIGTLQFRIAGAPA